MTGGATTHRDTSKRTTEWVNLITSTPGPDLPWEFSFHCIAKMNSHQVIMIGGKDHPERTLIVNVETSEMSRGPDLWQHGGRVAHSCAHIRHNNGSHYVIAASGYSVESHYTSEIINADNATPSWSPGDNLYVENRIFCEC